MPTSTSPPPLPGRIIVVCTHPEAPIGWRCSRCGDTAPSATGQQPPTIYVANDWPWPNPSTRSPSTPRPAATLRALQFLDIDCQRAVFAIHASDTRLHLAVTDTDLDELIGAVAAEANHEPNRRRQQRLDAAFEALNTAADTQGW